MVVNDIVCHPSHRCAVCVEPYCYTGTSIVDDCEVCAHSAPIWKGHGGGCVIEDNYRATLSGGKTDGSRRTLNGYLVHLGK